VVALLAAVYVESRVAEPMIPRHLFANRTVALSALASAMVGVAMFGSTVFLSQYFQLSRGMSPTEAGLMSLPMVVGMLLTSVVTGRLISRTGRWKRYLVAGATTFVAGVLLLAQLDATTDHGA
jgi:predicted MFS family arabinose efflux permease